MSKNRLQFEYEKAQQGASEFRQSWNEFLDLAYARARRSDDSRSHVQEGTLASLIYERACRVGAQPPTGRIMALSQQDTGKNQLMNLLWNRYVLPRANSQWDSEVKSRMWDFYSLVYGAMPAMYFYRADEQYIGPDWRVLNPAFTFPQAGRLSPHDCEKMYVESFHSVRELVKAAGQPFWVEDKLRDLVEKARNSTSAAAVSSDQTTNLQEERGEASDIGAGQIKLVTEYVRGKEATWRTFDPDSGDVVKEWPNSSPTGRMPVVFKHAMPLIDSFWGLGDIERGATLQRAMDSLTNLYMDGAKMAVFPPRRFSENINPSQVPWRPGANWRLPKSESVDLVNLAGNSLNIFQGSGQFIKGSLLNQNGTTDTTVAADQKFPGYGKSPEALSQIKERENARDSWDRSLLESAHEELYEGMIELIGAAPAEGQPPIEFYIFDEEIQQIAESGYTDILEISDSAIDHYINPDTEKESPTPAAGFEPVFSGGGSAKIKIDPKKLVGSYQYTVDAGSTEASSKKDQLQGLTTVAEFMATPLGQMAAQDLQATGKKIDGAEVYKALLDAAGLKNRDKIIVDIPEGQQEASADEAAAAEQTAEAAAEQEQAPEFDPAMIQDPAIQQILSQQGSSNG
jgi:hypothetical protein